MHNCAQVVCRAGVRRIVVDAADRRVQPTCCQAAHDSDSSGSGGGGRGGGDGSGGPVRGLKERSFGEGGGEACGRNKNVGPQARRIV